MTSPNDRLFHGYRLRTELALPSLPAASPGGMADIELRRGAVPQALEAPAWSGPVIEIGGDGAVLVRIGERLRFLVRGGRQVIVDAAAETPSGEIEAALFGVVAGALFHQRGDLALHASGVAIDGAAVAIAGPSGRGKSTLAAALAAEGHALLTDDVCRIAFEGGRAVALPGPPQLRLWPDSAEALGRTPAGLTPGRPGHAKRILPGIGPEPAAMALRAVIRLAVDARLDRPRLDPLTGPAAIMPAGELIYRLRLGVRLGRRAELFRGLTALAARVAVYRLARPEGPSDPPFLAALVRTAIGPGR